MRISMHESIFIFYSLLSNTEFKYFCFIYPVLSFYLNTRYLNIIYSLTSIKKVISYIILYFLKNINIIYVCVIQISKYL
jgi:hypothetical protein